MKRNDEYDIHDRIFRWVVAVLKFIESIPKSTAIFSVISQLTDSITSVGANDKEANSAQTVKEFCYKYGLVKKEADESIYWLKIIAALFEQRKPEVERLIIEGEELIRIVATIIMNSKKTSASRKLK